MRLLKILSVGLVGTILNSCSSMGYDRGESSVVAEEKIYGNIPYESVSVIKVYPKDRKKDEIKGICFVVSTPESFFDLPCKGIDFDLFSLDGQLIETAQTDDEGRFRFSVTKKMRYLLKVNSSKYKTYSEKIILSAGVDTLVRLIKK
jgi:hypothetical protein